MKWPWTRSSRSELAMERGGYITGNATIFVDDALKTGGWRLDFSEHSVAVLEEMLATLSLRSSQLPDSERAMIVDWAGCYLLEVGRRQFGGTYKFYEQRSLPILVVGEPTFSAAFLAHDKIAGRLSGDKTDNLPLHYEGLRQAVIGKNRCSTSKPLVLT